MTKQIDPKGSVRASFAMSELKQAQHSISGGPVCFIIRVVMAIIFMYMIVISYQMFGSSGSMLVSILFITAPFVPAIFRKVNTVLNKQQVLVEGSLIVEETVRQDT